ncbi:hypothetical protein EDD85DRAFT_798754 [Armillaria nabsnona]|nr:hypothetical protein EDD85DRAFT_798754 [Armillaria nabsnona]
MTFSDWSGTRASGIQRGSIKFSYADGAPDFRAVQVALGKFSYEAPTWFTLVSLRQPSASKLALLYNRTSLYYSFLNLFERLFSFLSPRTKQCISQSMGFLGRGYTSSITGNLQAETHFGYHCSSSLPAHSRSSHDDLASTTPHSGSLPESGNSSIAFQPVNVVDTALPSPDTTTVFGESEKPLPEDTSNACSVIGELFYPIAPTEFERSRRPDEVSPIVCMDELQPPVEAKPLNRGLPTSILKGPVISAANMICLLSTPTLFWLDEFESSERLWPKINGVTSPDHILHEIQSQYWYGQIEPNVHHRALSVSSIIEELRRMLQLLPVKSGEANDDFGPGTQTLLLTSPTNTFLHFYGEPVARLSRGTSIYDKNKVHKRSFLFHILKYLLFAAPCAHLGEIDYLLSDGLLSQIVCREFIDKICKDWSHPTIYSTVLINVDVGLLSIQSVDTSPTSSPLKGIIYLLILSALGSLFFARLLLRHNKTRSNISTCEAVNIMNSYQDSSCRYDNIAIIYSLLIFFFVTAFAIMCLWDTAPVTLVLSIMRRVALGSLVIFYGWVSSTEARRQWLLLIREFLGRVLVK